MSFLKFILTILLTYALYVFIFGIVIFAFYKPSTSDYLETYNIDRFFSEDEGQDRVALVEERFHSGLARINLIDNAEQSLDIAYYTLHDGKSLTFFLGSILNAADRGVEVRILLDGMFHNLRGDLKDVIYTFSHHENIELKFYEPFNLVQPWTINNRLHDKFMIVDDQRAIIGGRNIGDKYFSPEKNDGATNDRDVVILNTDLDNFSGSVIYEMKDYFELVWHSQFSQKPLSQLTSRQKNKGRDKAKGLKEQMDILSETYPEYSNHPFDWLEKSVPTNNITLIHNPIERFNKEPHVWYEIFRLMEASEESIFIQSPYIIPTKNMLNYFAIDDVSFDNVTVLSNSLASTPNNIAYSGHIRNREKMIDLGITVYEYQGPGSIHAKTYAFDDRISLIGSFNFDSRSTFLSTETLVVIDSEEFFKLLDTEIERYIQNKSLLVAEDYSYQPNSQVEEAKVPFLKYLRVRLLSIFAYFFDFLL